MIRCTDIRYGELASARRSKGRPQLRYKGVCKRDMKALDINTESWEDLATDRMMWRSTLNKHLKSREEKLVNAKVGKRACRKERNNSDRPETTHQCDFCGRDCFSHIGLYSHKRRCNNQTDRTTRMYSHDQTWSTEAIVVAQPAPPCFYCYHASHRYRYQLPLKQYDLAQSSKLWEGLRQSAQLKETKHPPSRLHKVDLIFLVSSGAWTRWCVHVEMFFIHYIDLISPPAPNKLVKLLVNRQS